MVFTDDPVADFHRYDAEQERKLQALPKCSECGEPIQGGFCYEINGGYVCEECLKENHMKSVDSIVEE